MTLIKLNNKLITLGGKHITVPKNPLQDGNTVAWYDFTDLSTITKDSNDFVSRWNDKLNSGHDLLQPIGSSQPKWVNSNGILFDGVDDWMDGSFTFSQPEFIYIVFKQLGWADPRYIFDGYNTDGGYLRQRIISPNWQLVAGGIGITINNAFPLNEFGIVRALINGANSKIIPNNFIPSTGTLNAGNMGGFTLAQRGQQNTFRSNIQVKEVILRNVVDTPTNEINIYNYLKIKYNL
jgi:hypothetical protein